MKIYEITESDPKRLLRLEIGHKSNRMPILNSAAARLGQALRETQDALVRDNLESSASVINCVNGQNGRNIAVVKSSLIDLEAPMGDRAQAYAA